MITEVVLLIAGLAGTLGIGIPIANNLANPHRWRSLWGTDRATRSERPRLETTPAYKPLDLGPDLTKWPSERAWPTTSTLREPQWPSRSWNDEHFGTHWRNSTADHVQDRGFHAMAGRAPVAAEAPTPARPPPQQARPAPATPSGRPAAALEAPSPAAEDSWFEESVGGPPVSESADELRRRAGELRRKQQNAPTTDEAKRRQQQTALEQARRNAASTGRPQPSRSGKPAQPRPAPARIPDPRTRGRAAVPPERADLEHLISTVGLAGTVQAIMDRTGWEFREAAAYLAKIRTSKG